MRTVALPPAAAVDVTLCRGSGRQDLAAAVSVLEGPAVGGTGGPVVGLPAYRLLGVQGAGEQVLVTPGMLRRLGAAAAATPLQLCVLDGIRAAALQRTLAEATGEAVAEGYVAPPGSSRHESGEAVDVTLLHRGRVLLLGSGFDQFSPASWRDARVGEEAGVLRAHLERIMSEAGLHGHPKEWWHYSLDGR